MKTNKLNRKLSAGTAIATLLLSFSITLCFMACNDDVPEMRPTSDPTNAIGFRVTSGIQLNATRTPRDTSDLLNPQILSAEELDFPLYLHRYVADESERATGGSAETRGIPVGDVKTFYDLNNGEGFFVQAHFLKADNTDGRFFINPTDAKHVENNEIWNVSPQRYWPDGDPELRFYAIAPTSAQSTLLKDVTMQEGTVSFSYTTPKSADGTADAEAQPDIMFATTDCKHTSDAVVDGKVPLNFRHALSAIKFAVRDVAAGTINKITIRNVSGSATCEFYETATTETTTNQEKAEAAFTWTNHSDANEVYTQDFNIAINDKYYDNPNNDSGDNDVVLNNEMPEKTFMLIPQKISDAAEIEITYTRSVDSKNFTFKGKINDDNITEWLPGHEYIYTISTSSSNWIYVFDVMGVVQEDNDTNPLNGKFNENKESLIVNYTVEEGAYYKVRSYRWPANNMIDSKKEPVAWSITDFEGVNHKPSSGTINPDLVNSITDKNITSDYWLGLQEEDYNQPGSTDYTQYDVVFFPQMVTTDWAGDWELQARNPLGTKDSPIDLSMIDETRSTANCYVINSSGYFQLPLVYGNLITKGVEDTDRSSCVSASKGTPCNEKLYPILPEYIDRNGEKIPSVWIEGADDAILVWQDAYNLIGNVELSEDKKFISFTVNREHIQQGNAVLAVRDSDDKIIWSWHIWITEYWTNKGDLRLGSGDVTCNAYDEGYGTFTVAPRSLGWCDAKNEWYLQRTGTMEFTQETSNKKAQLKVEQREKKVEYWIGNNVYYQFGRKDPFVGFRGTSSKIKYNFGEYHYKIEPQTKTIKDGILNPDVMYVGAEPDRTNNDWLETSYCNLWNNTSIPFTEEEPTNKGGVQKYHYSGVKTVYDPCPVGYQVPPVGFFRYFTPLREPSLEISAKELNESNDEFNGVVEVATPPQGENSKNKYYKWYTNVGNQTILFTTTGHRWYANDNVGAGNNFNPQIVYLWSNQVRFKTDDKCAFGLALGHVGYDNGNDLFALSFRFEGRRAMARPVRPVKIFNDQAFTAK